MTHQFGTVVSTERLSSTMVRLVFGGEGLADFEPTDATDDYVNALFLTDESPLTVPFDLDAEDLAPEHRPRGRRFTIRHWDEAKREATIDFVAHGDVGFAGRWAQHATVGDRLQMTGPSGSYRPNEAAAWHLLVGDESALPAIGASLEALDPGARAVVVVVVDGPEGQVHLPSPAAVDVHWVHRSTSPEPESALLAAVETLGWAPGEVDVFVHGEAGETRAIRKHLIADRRIDRDTASISPYWRRDHTDEAWREVKRQWIAEQAADV